MKTGTFIAVMGAVIIAVVTALGVSMTATGPDAVADGRVRLLVNNNVWSEGTCPDWLEVTIEADGSGFVQRRRADWESEIPEHQGAFSFPCGDGAAAFDESGENVLASEAFALDGDQRALLNERLQAVVGDREPVLRALADQDDAYPCQSGEPDGWDDEPGFNEPAVIKGVALVWEFPDDRVLYYFADETCTASQWQPMRDAVAMLPLETLLADMQWSWPEG